MCPRERRADDPLHALPRVDFLGDVLVARGTPATEVLAFGVFAEDDEVDGRNAQGRQVGVEQLYRTEIDVEIELESQTQEDVAGMFVARHSRIAECRGRWHRRRRADGERRRRGASLPS